ncbi:hypothetical protein [Roseibium sp.]|uniref:hypothetical protein n=1 Tax=Roseibium sp. TaxID=1936156 RepID=UPI003A96ACD7
MATIWGVVSEAGAMLSGSTDRDGNPAFKVANVSPGVYQIVFESTFPSVPAITGSQVLYGKTSEIPLDNIVFPLLDAEGATAVVGDSSGNLTNRSFSFIVAGDDGR